MCIALVEENQWQASPFYNCLGAPGAGWLEATRLTFFVILSSDYSLWGGLKDQMGFFFHRTYCGVLRVGYDSLPAYIWCCLCCSLTVRLCTPFVSSQSVYNCLSLSLCVILFNAFVTVYVSISVKADFPSWFTMRVYWCYWCYVIHIKQWYRPTFGSGYCRQSPQFFKGCSLYILEKTQNAFHCSWASVIGGGCVSVTRCQTDLFSAIVSFFRVILWSTVCKRS